MRPFFGDCRKKMKKEQKQKNDSSIQDNKPSASRSFEPCPHCQRTNHPPKNAAVVPMSLMDPNSSKRIIQQTIKIMGTLTHSGAISILQNTLNQKSHDSSGYTSVRQYVISDPLASVYHSQPTLNTGILSVVWQQQMEKAYNQRYNILHMIH